MNQNLESQTEQTENTVSSEIDSNLKTNQIEVPLPQNMTQQTSLEDNIVEVSIPDSENSEIDPVFQETKEVTPIEEVKVIEEAKNASPMVEQEKEEEIGNPKGMLWIFLTFGFFLILIIGLPYISDFIEKLEKNNQENITPQVTAQPTPSPTITPSPETTQNDETLEAYQNCGTEEVFTDIVIDYTKASSQCFKVSLNGEKNYIEYIPSSVESKTKQWKISLGERLLYTGLDQSNTRIQTIHINKDGSFRLEEYDSNGKPISSYIYNQGGDFVNKVPKNS